MISPQVVRTSAGPVEVAVAGRGPALLVVHGMPGDWRQGRSIVTDFADRAQVLLLSRPGYGATPLRVGRTPEEQARAYAALLDALGIDQAVVVGISGGAPSAYAFAAEHRQRCRGLVLCCAVAAHLVTAPAKVRVLATVPGLWRGLSALARIVQRRQLRDQAKVQTAMLAELTTAERAQLDERMRIDLLAFAADRVEALRGPGLRNDARQFIEATARPPLAWPVDVSVPTVVLHGDADTVIPLSHGEYYAAAIPGARLDVLPGFGHPVPLTARTRLGAAIRELLCGSE